MEIYVHYNWSRGLYNNDNGISSTVFLESERGKKQVTDTIREWAKEWTGKGHISLISVETTFREDDKFCDIKTKKFNFSN